MTNETDLAARRAAVNQFRFNQVHPLLRFGTASDRYAGWLGQIYPDEKWSSRVKSRTKRVGGVAFEERTLPVESTSDYFDHFRVVELDFTFYRPLLDSDGEPTNNHFVLDRYAECAPAEARFILKAPQAYSARTLRRAGQGKPSYDANPTYLDAQAYSAQFLRPAVELLGDQLAGVVFEQEYARVVDSPEPDAFVSELARFFAAPELLDAGRAAHTHLEVRSPHLLGPAYFEWLGSAGLGFVYSHWTWLPSIREQWEMTGADLLQSQQTAILRLLTPRRMRYADAYAAAHPFMDVSPVLSENDGTRTMIDEAVALAYRAIEAGATLNIIANNRAYGNAPLLNQAIAHRFLDFADRRGV